MIERMMSFKPPPSSRSSDRGAVLLLTLVLTIVFGLLVVGIATYTTTALRSSRVTEHIVDRLAAAESGMQYALGRADAGNCPGAFTDGTINQAVVTTTCTSVQRIENADGLFALVVTGEGVPSSTDALEIAGANCTNGECDKKISGPVYLGEGISVDIDDKTAYAIAINPGPPEEIVGGDVRFDVPGDCQPTSVSPAPASAWADPEPVVSCDSRGWQTIASSPSLMSDPLGEHPDLQRATLYSATGDVPYSADAIGSLARPFPTPNVDGCTVYSPGWFDGSVIGNTLDIDTPTFFESGVYYFENVTINIDSQVAVGKRSDLLPAPRPSVGVDYPTECDGVWSDPSTAASGAVWILGGSSRIYGANNDDGNLDFYPRRVQRTAASFGPADMAVIAFPSGSGGYLGSTLSPVASDPLIGRSNGPKNAMSFYGLIHAPASWIDSNTVAPGKKPIFEFVGGMVVARLSVFLAAQVDGFNISVPYELVPYYMIESTSTREGISTTVRTVSRRGDAGLEVITWRVCSDFGC